MTLLPDKDNLAKHLKELTHLSIYKLAPLVGVSYHAYYLWFCGKQPGKRHCARLRELLEQFQANKEQHHEH